MVVARRPLPRAWWIPLLALGFCAGEAAPAGLSFFAAALALAGPGLSRRNRRWGLAIALVGAGWVGGGVRAAAPWRAPEAWVADVPLRYRGIVEDSSSSAGTDAGPAAEVVLRLLDSPPESGLEVGARMRIAVWRGAPRFEVGELLELVARARSPRGLCNGGADPYAAAAERRGIAAEASVSDPRVFSRHGVERRWWDPAYLGRVWRDRTEARIQSTLAPTEAAVVRALVLGDQRDVAPEIRRIFARSGTTHVLSVSGLHVAMVAAAVLAITGGVATRLPWLAARISSRQVGALAAMPAVAGYAWLTSPGSPILRAAIMAELYLLALAARRRFHFATSLAFAAVIVGGSEPDAPWDVSAQLSFVTVLSIWAGMRLLQGGRYGPRRRRWRSMERGGPLARVAIASLAAVAASAAATLGAAPILAWHFGEVSIVGLLANPIVVPLMGWGALGLGLAGMILVPVAPEGSSAAFRLSGLCVRLSVAAAGELAEWPLATVPLSWEPALVSCAAMTLAALPAPGPLGRAGRAALGALVAGVVVLALSPSAPGLRADFLDVGQGDAALVELGPTGPRLMIDGGGLARGREPGYRVLLPALRRRRIDRLDAAVVSHPEWDHFGGLETVVREEKAAAIWWAGQHGHSAAWHRFEAALQQHRVALRVARGGHFLPLPRARGAVEVLHPPAGFEPGSANDASLVLRVRYGATALLFSGDIEARAEASLVARGGSLAATILKVPHHGSATSSGAAFVRVVRPALAIASLGRGNPFRFPAEPVVERYRRIGSEWASTDRMGELVVESDGQVIRLRRCRTDDPAERRRRGRW